MKKAGWLVSLVSQIIAVQCRQEQLIISNIHFTILAFDVEYGVDWSDKKGPFAQGKRRIPHHTHQQTPASEKAREKESESERARERECTIAK